MENQIKIGPEFFSKIKRDYADWRWALVREYLQNCFDAPGCRNVSVNTGAHKDGTVLIVANDGAPMDRETLVGKLLTLGGSGKNFTGENTGGFGVAKSLLYYCHNSYTVRTGNLLVEGSGAQYNISETDRLFGTQSSVIIPGSENESITREVVRFASLAQWKATLTLNGKTLETNLHKGARRRDLGWGIVYTNNSFTGLCVVRLNGQPMFRLGTSYKGCVLVELVGKAMETLTSNRDGLKHPYGSQLSELLTALAVDKKSALREQKAEYKRYQGEKAKAEAEKPKAQANLGSLVDLNTVIESITGGCANTSGVTVILDNSADQSVILQAMPAKSGIAALGGACSETVSMEDAPATISLGTEFILKNTTGKKMPGRFIPGDNFSDTSKQLVKAWTAVLLKLHKICNVSGTFSVGFIIDEETEAEHEVGTYGRVYYINPNTIKSPWKNRHRLISIAAHELVHGAYGLNQHDEDYAGVLTEVMAIVMEHASEFDILCYPNVVHGKMQGTTVPAKKLR